MDSDDINFMKSMDLVLRHTGLSLEGCGDNDASMSRGNSTAFDRENALIYQKVRKNLLYGRSVKKHENKSVNSFMSEKISEGRDMNIVMHRVIVVATYACWPVYMRFIQLLKEWPGRSPSVNISWFIAKAYLANFYYTTQRDVNLTLQTCDDIIEVYGQSYMNRLFAERTFSVVLSTQWTGIYDKDLQEMLGFYSLCSFVSGVSNRSVCVRVCPVLFALYAVSLKLRSVMYLISCRHWTMGDGAIFSDLIIYKCIEDYKGHVRACLYNRERVSGAFGLLSLVVVYKLKRNQ